MQCCSRVSQVLLINGREVSSMTHEQVVNSIKASKECHSGELVLTVKQNGKKLIMYGKSTNVLTGDQVIYSLFQL